MFLHSAVARRSQGLVTGGDAGRQLVESGDAALRAESITNPERLAAVIAPGVQSV
jgi:ethanolamine ammonia-lyase small subunit